MEEILIIAFMAATAAFAAVSVVKLRRKDDFYCAMLSDLSLTVSTQEKKREVLENKIKALESCCVELTTEVDRLKRVTDEFPVEDMRNAAKKEALFFEGLQNIIDYNPENVPSLNKEVINIGR